MMVVFGTSTCIIQRTTTFDLSKLLIRRAKNTGRCGSYIKLLPPGLKPTAFEAVSFQQRLSDERGIVLKLSDRIEGSLVSMARVHTATAASGDFQSQQNLPASAGSAFSRTVPRTI